MPAPKRYRITRERPCRICGGKVVCLGEQDYVEENGRAYRGRMWHCLKCGASAVQEVQGEAGAPKRILMSEPIEREEQ